MEPTPVPKMNFDQVGTAVGTAVTDTLTLFASLLPYALAVFAGVWGVRKAMSFFKSASK